ncbi:type VI secretion system lipoprotein TssJ [Providencia sp. PROV130]|uniref:type VI secretion system lipoprotein TssJ n=1 Tax=Providencia sp. PROV130 TaxID=2949840 RepID=UPI00234B07FF|nr:type VI secretion system lipoprotein TssJ [Providencia sp. PROV130]
MKQFPLFSFCSKTLMLLSALNLSGCGLTQMVGDGTRNVASSLFYKQVKVVHLDFVAREALNTDDTGASLSTIIRVYQLKNFESFVESDYSTLFAKDSQVLKSSLVTQKDLRIRPGESISLDMPLEEGAEFVAIAVMFHHPDLVTDDWRVVIPKKRLLPDDPRLLTLVDNTMTLKPLGEK